MFVSFQLAGQGVAGLDSMTVNIYIESLKCVGAGCGGMERKMLGVLQSGWKTSTRV